MDASTRYKLKTALVWIAHFFTWVLALPAVLENRFYHSERVFDFSAKLLSLIPGKMGQYVRASFYMQTLAECHYDLYIGFASFFSHMTARVGRGVGIGSFSIVGTARLEDEVLIASRVSILSGKYQHGGRGREVTANVYYEQVRIGKKSWLGEGCVVMADVGSNCIVSAGSVVTRAVPEGATAIGNPARPVRFNERKVETTAASSANGGASTPNTESPPAVGATKPSAAPIFVTCLVLAMTAFMTPHSSVAAERHIVLVGASIGRAWNIPAAPERLKLSGVQFEYVGVPDSFDKGSAIQQLATRAEKPDAVIIKECSVYFPADLTRYRAMVVQWVDYLQAHHVRPVLATSVPPGRASGGMARAKEWVKTDVLGRPDKLAQVSAYNDWLRAFAHERGLALLDLERTLRVSDTDRSLRPDYDVGDHVHINARAYAAIDAMLPTLVLRLADAREFVVQR